MIERIKLYNGVSVPLEVSVFFRYRRPTVNRLS